MAGDALTAPGADGEMKASVARSSKPMTRRTAAVAMTLAAHAGCGDSDGSSGASGSSDSTSTTGADCLGSYRGACQCEACEERGGTCGDGCVDAFGWRSSLCYFPTAPNAGEFSCDGVVNCYVGQVCLFEKAWGDGCSDHRCSSPPLACASDPTCACITPLLATGTCEEKNGGPYVVFPPGADPW